MSAPQSLSDWVLALLPRLFLYPGGLWLVGALLASRALSSGWGANRPAKMARAFLDASPISLAVAWVAIALLAVPGSLLLPVPVDRWVVPALFLISLAIEQGREQSEREVWAREALVAIGITLALLAPLAGGQALLARDTGFTLSGLLSSLAVVAGLLVLASDGPLSLGAGVRWIGWLGAGLLPLLGWTQAPLSDMVWVSLVYLVATVTLTLGARRIRRRTSVMRMLWLAWGLSIAALVTALVGY